MTREEFFELSDGDRVTHNGDRRGVVVTTSVDASNPYEGDHRGIIIVYLEGDKLDANVYWEQDADELTSGWGDGGLLDKIASAVTNRVDGDE